MTQIAPPPDAHPDRSPDSESNEARQDLPRRGSAVVVAMGFVAVVALIVGFLIGLLF